MLDLNTNGKSIRDALTHVELGQKAWVWLAYVGSSETIIVKTSGQNLKTMSDATVATEIIFVTRCKIRIYSLGMDALLNKFHLSKLGSTRMGPKTIQLIKNGDEIMKLCKTIHLKISARENSDIDWREISQKASIDSFKKPSEHCINQDYHDEEEEDKPKKQFTPEPQLKGIIANRITALYQQKASSTYRPVNFREELEKARSIDQEPVEPIHGAKYTRPDFKSEIAMRDQATPTYSEQKPITTNEHKTRKISQNETKSPSKMTSTSSISSTAVRGAATSTTTAPINTNSTSTGSDEMDIDGKYNFEGICIFAFENALDDEITIKPGDRITNICKFDNKWLWGTLPNGESGRFPKSYVELFDETAEDL